MKPIKLSPGMGLQHLPKLIITLSIPSIIIALSFLDEVKLKKLLLDILVFLNFVISFGLIFFKISRTVIFPDPIAFIKEFSYLAKNFIGRPTPLYYAENLTKYLGGAKIYFKRDELNHTGAHKINNCLGQVLLANRMNKKRIIAETGAGQHGLATATVCALF